VAVDEEGEVLIGGEGLLAGYLGRGVLHDPREPDGTFATGDLGRLDPDGVLRILGRRDRRFTVGGENVHPEEVEGVLTDLPGILTAVVVPRNDEELGAVPVAFVRCDPLAGVTLDRVLEHLRERLERWKEPRDLWLLDDHDEVKPRPGALAARVRDRSPRRRLRPLR
jgi:acyl-CoA synthetase (AMP-forming)/AMP-acid ligase II